MPGSAASPPAAVAILAPVLGSRTARRLLWVLAAVLWTCMVVVQIRRGNPLGWLDLRVYRDSSTSSATGGRCTTSPSPRSGCRSRTRRSRSSSWPRWPGCRSRWRPGPCSCSAGSQCWPPAGPACNRWPVVFRPWRWRPRSPAEYCSSNRSGRRSTTGRWTCCWWTRLPSTARGAGPLPRRADRGARGGEADAAGLPAPPGAAPGLRAVVGSWSRSRRSR